jgi:hypothetical protein
MSPFYTSVDTRPRPLLQTQHWFVANRACIDPSNITNCRNFPIQFDSKSERGVAGEKGGPSARRQNCVHQKGLRKIKFSHMLWLLPAQVARVLQFHSILRRPE